MPSRTGTPTRLKGSSTKPACSAGECDRQAAGTGFKRKLKAVHNQVKIDQSFVRDVATSPSDNMLVKVIVSMAHGLGMKVIAEGVETEAQCDIMRSSSCDEIQGYFFSRPISGQAIEALFSEGRQLPAHLLRAHGG